MPSGVQFWQSGRERVRRGREGFYINQCNSATKADQVYRLLIDVASRDIDVSDVPKGHRCQRPLRAVATKSTSLKARERSETAPSDRGEQCLNVTVEIRSRPLSPAEEST